MLRWSGISVSLAVATRICLHNKLSLSHFEAPPPRAEPRPWGPGACAAVLFPWGSAARQIRTSLPAAPRDAGLLLAGVAAGGRRSDSSPPAGGSGSRKTQRKRASMSGADASGAERCEPRAAAAGENPLVFLCARCRRPLGDSLTWVAGQEDNNCILLRCVSSNVSVDKEQKLSKCRDEDGCILETLSCTGCSLSLGYVYRCTPRRLDYKRDLFCLSVEAIESYTLGSSEKQIVPEDKELFNLESRVEIEKSIKQMEDVLKALEMKLWEVESKLSFAGRCS
ncbi:protein Mis18-alpha [Mesocricetus auratus]|uniref:Protein Mis18-alpha n=1 Tax=Mesocricetus auratus TaxID=10036 RepID=A0ABM2XUB8_MESAU|nr:protein Mis18-alpha [Mesocricetus auratus]